MAHGHVYQEINFDSTTENLLSDEAKETSNQCSAPRKRSCIAIFSTLLHHYWWLFDFVGILIIGALSLALIMRRASGNHMIGGDVTGFAPTFSQHIHAFSPEPKYFPKKADDWFTEETHQAWLNMMPRGGGVVKLADPSKYSPLPKPLGDKGFVRLNETAFITSVGHQFHCLHTVSDAFYRLASTPAKEIPEKMLLHVPHCFAYLRQSIQCNGDMALEGSDPRFEDSLLGANQGWDGLHICKDFSQIKEHLEDNKALDIPILKREFSA